MNNASIEQRLRAMERAMRRWKYATIMTLVGVCVLGAVRFSSAGEKAGALVVNELIVRDQLGEARLTSRDLVIREGKQIRASLGHRGAEASLSLGGMRAVLSESALRMGGLELRGGADPHITMLSASGAGRQTDVGPGFVGVVGDDKGGTLTLDGRAPAVGLRVHFYENGKAQRWPAK